jgi:hypothetical protein
MAKALVLIGILFLINTILLVGNFQVRLANISSDDGIVAKAYFLKFPERYQHDPQLKYQALGGFASAMNWVPALLFKYFDVNPEGFEIGFVFLQNILLGLSMYLLALLLTGRSEAAWVSVAFVMLTRPHWSNLASYGDLDWMAYAAHLAVPLILLSASFTLEGRRLWGNVLLLIAGAIHPSLALYYIVMLAIYFAFFERTRPTLKERLKDILVLTLFAVAIVLPPKIILHGIPEIPSDLVFQNLLGNKHIFPTWDALAENIQFIALLLVLTYFGLATLKSPKAKRFLIAVWSASFILCVTPILGYLLKNNDLLRLIGHRSSELAILFSIPLAAYHLVYVFQNSGFLKRFAVAFFLIPTGYVLSDPTPVMYALIFLTAPISLLKSLSASQRRGLELSLSVVGTAWLAFVLFSHRGQIWEWKFSIIVPGLIASLPGIIEFYPRVVPARLKAHTVPTLAIGLCVACMFVVGLHKSKKSGSSSTTGEFRKFYDLESWVKERTPPDANFIIVDNTVYGGWRNLTLRPLIPLFTRPPYLMSEESEASNLKVKAFFDLQFHHKNSSEPGACVPCLDREGLLALKDALDANYIVVRRERPEMPLPVAYENELFKVYEIR